MSSLWHGAPYDRGGINHNDSIRKSRSKKSQSKHRVSEQVVKEIRALADFRGWTKGKLAERYNLKVSTVKNILEGITGALVTHSAADVPAAE